MHKKLTPMEANKLNLVHARAVWQEVSLAPATFVRSLARKLTADIDVQDQQLRKVSTYNTHT